MTNTRTLSQISQKIKLLEKNNKSMEKKTIGNVVEIGKLLREADDQCKHGDYQAWIKREFTHWSHSTALNYRSVYDLTQNRNVTNLAGLDISLNALYLLARIMNYDPSPDVIAVGK